MEPGPAGGVNTFLSQLCGVSPLRPAADIARGPSYYQTPDNISISDTQSVWGCMWSFSLPCSSVSSPGVISTMTSPTVHSSYQGEVSIIKGYHYFDFDQIYHLYQGRTIPKTILEIRGSVKWNIETHNPIFQRSCPIIINTGPQWSHIQRLGDDLDVGEGREAGQADGLQGEGGGQALPQAGPLPGEES